MKNIFATFVTDLRIYNTHKYCRIYDNSTSYECLTKVTEVSFYNKHPLSWELPESVRHIVVDGSYFASYEDLRGIFNHFEHIETLELKNAGSFNDIQSYKMAALKLGKLKKLIFNYRSEFQFENLKKIYKGTNIQLVPVFPNSNAN